MTTTDATPPNHDPGLPPWLRIEATLIATARAVRRAYDGVLSEVGVTLAEATVLALLVTSEALTQTQIANKLDAGRATTGLRIDSLAEKGLVQRHPDPADRRSWLVGVTPQGRLTAVKIDELDREFRDQVRSGLTREQRQQLAVVLLRIRQNLEGLEPRRLP